MKQLSIGKHISAIYRQQSILINHLFSDYEIGSSQYLFLIHIDIHEGINQKELSKLVAIDRANTTRALKKLEALGLVRSIKNENDKRNHQLYLTQDGVKLMPTIKKKLKIVTEILTSGMTQTEHKELERLLQKSSSNIQQAIMDIKEDMYVD